MCALLSLRAVALKPDGEKLRLGIAGGAGYESSEIYISRRTEDSDTSLIRRNNISLDSEVNICSDKIKTPSRCPT